MASAPRLAASRAARGDAGPMPMSLLAGPAGPRASDEHCGGAPGQERRSCAQRHRLRARRRHMREGAQMCMAVAPPPGLHHPSPPYLDDAVFIFVGEGRSCPYHLSEVLDAILVLPPQLFAPVFAVPLFMLTDGQVQHCTAPNCDSFLYEGTKQVEQHHRSLEPGHLASTSPPDSPSSAPLVCSGAMQSSALPASLSSMEDTTPAKSYVMGTLVAERPWEGMAGLVPVELAGHIGEALEDLPPADDETLEEYLPRLFDILVERTPYLAFWDGGERSMFALTDYIAQECPWIDDMG